MTTTQATYPGDKTMTRNIPAPPADFRPKQRTDREIAANTARELPTWAPAKAKRMHAAVYGYELDAAGPPRRASYG